MDLSCTHFELLAGFFKKENGVRILLFPFRLIAGFGTFFFGIFAALIAIATIWFVPWVFVLKLGFLVYFPYKSDGRSRYMSVTGPHALKMESFKERAWVEKVPSFCLKALVAAEDAHFYSHKGVDWEATQKALEVHLKQSD
jgi:monofunctional glycosyltransferase